MKMMRVVVVAFIVAISLVSAFDEHHFQASKHEQTHEEVSKYWTAERMAAAITKDITISEKDAPQQPIHKNSVPTEGKVIPGTIPQHMQVKEENVSAGGYPFPYTGGFAPYYNNYPYSTIGRVYYTQNGGNYVATASVVGKYLIQTSGDVVYDTTHQQWSTNIYFIPGYNYGSAPFGSFTYYKSYTNTAFMTNKLQNYNFAMIVLYPSVNSGYAIGNAVGTLGLAWNQSYVQTWRIPGYPANYPYTGSQDHYTDSPYGALDSSYGSFTIGVGNDGSNGMSGAPYVLAWGSGYLVNSVVAYKYTNQPYAVYGPYFTTAAYYMYLNASQVTPPSK